MEKVSVIIPTFNRENTIKRAVESVLEQTYNNLEVIIVDDCSNDETKNIISSINDSRVKIIKHPLRKGAAAARNTGIKNSSGSFVSFQDSDDEWYKSKLQMQMDLFNSNAQIDVIFSSFWLIRDNIKKKIPSRKAQRNILYKNILLDNYVGTPTVILKRKVFERIGYFDENLPRYQDWDLAIRLFKHCTVFYLNEPTVNAYIQKNSITNNENIKTKSLEIIFNKYKNDIFMEKKILSHFQYKLGSSYLNDGNKDFSKECFKKSIKNNFLNIKSIIKLLLIKIL